MKELILEEQALAEYRDATSRYAADNPAAALRFVDLVEAAIDGIQREPHSWPLDPTVPAALGVRRTRIDGYPYSVVYMETASELHVLAVAHGKREPGFWRGRLPSAR